MTIAGNLRTMSFPDILQWLANGDHTETLVALSGLVNANHVKLEPPEPG